MFPKVNVIEGIGFTVELDTDFGPIGIFVTEAATEDNHTVAAGVLVDLPFTEELAAAVASRNRTLRMGGLVLCPDSMVNDKWRLVACCRIQRSWLNPRQEVSYQIAQDLFKLVAGGTYDCMRYLLREMQFPGSPWPLTGDWWRELMEHL